MSLPVPVRPPRTDPHPPTPRTVNPGSGSGPARWRGNHSMLPIASLGVRCLPLHSMSNTVGTGKPDNYHHSDSKYAIPLLPSSPEELEIQYD